MEGETEAAGVSLKTTSSKFEDCFWGKDNNGYSTLIHNLKGSVVVANTLTEFIKELMTVKKAYIKGLQKLTKYLQQVPDTQLGSYYPVWLVFMKMVDSMVLSHEQQVVTLGDLAGEVTQYGNKQEDKMKGYMKGEIDAAHKSLSAYNKSRTTVGKTRKAYRGSCKELIVYKVELERAKLEGGVKGGKEVEKLEGKVKKATAHMESALKEHNGAIKHQADQLTEFKEKMTAACQRFEKLEDVHVVQMLSYTNKLITTSTTCWTKVCSESEKAKEKLDQLPSSKLIQMFAQIKGTGRRRPEPYQLTVIDIDEEVSKLLQNRPESPATKSKGLFKSKKKKKSVSPAPSAGAADASGTAKQNETNAPEVDEEGYTIRPKDADKIAWSDEENENSHSDSDSDWEDETEKKLRGLQIKDKPTTSTAATIDDLSKAVVSIKLGGPGGMKSASSSQSLQSIGSANTPSLRRSPTSGSQSLLDTASGNTSSSTLPSQDPLASLLDLGIALQPTAVPLIPSSSAFASSFTTSTTSAPSDFPGNVSAPALSTTSSLPPWSMQPLPPPLIPFNNVSASLTPENLSTPSLELSDEKKEEDEEEKEKSSVNSLNLAGQPKSHSSPRTVHVPANQPSLGLLPPPPSGGGGRRRIPGPTNDALLTPPASQASSGKDNILSPISPLTVSRQSANDVSSTGTGNGSISLTTPAVATTAASGEGGGGGANVVPIAVAFQETCNAIFKGSDPSRAVVKVTGEVIFSFPANYLPELSNHEPLQFSLIDYQKLSRVLHNQYLMTRSEGKETFVFEMDKLCAHLRTMKEKHSSPFYNVQVLKYEVVLDSAGSLPLQLSCMWKCDPASTVYRLDYSYNSSSISSPSPPPLKNVSISVSVGNTVTDVFSQPVGVWLKEQGKISWKIGDLEPSDESGTLQAKLTLPSGSSSSPSPTIIQFLCDGGTLSGSSLQLATNAYKISLHKNKCISGRYMAEPAQHINH